MKYFNNFYIVLLLAAGLFASCSNDTINDSNEEEQTVTDGCNVTFRLSSPGISVTTRSAEDSFNSEMGTESEWKVITARVYLFDSKTKLFSKTFTLENLTRTNDVTTGYITYTANHVAIPQGTYDIFVVANSTNVIKAESEKIFINNIDKDTYKEAQIENTSNGIVMSNRASANLNTKIQNNKYEEDNVVEVMLERVVARIDVARSAEKFDLKDETGAKYVTISLDGFHYVNLPKSYYTFRHTAVLTSLDVPEWDITKHFGNIDDVNGYVIDPYFFNKPIDASAFENPDAFYDKFYSNYNYGTGVKWLSFKNITTPVSYNTCYSLENCTLQPAQKNGYSTGVVFRAVVEPNDNVYKLNDSQQLAKITDKADYPNVLYYFNYKFYNSIDALHKAGASAVKAEMDDVELEYIHVRRYTLSDGKYYTYYPYWIKHLDNNNPLDMGVMEFGVVRNNLYRLVVTGVNDLGRGFPTVNPDTPDEGETYLKVNLNVKPWIVREQTNIIL